MACQWFSFPVHFWGARTIDISWRLDCLMWIKITIILFAIFICYCILILYLSFIADGLRLRVWKQVFLLSTTLLKISYGPFPKVRIPLPGCVFKMLIRSNLEDFILIDNHRRSTCHFLVQNIQLRTLKDYSLYWIKLLLKDIKKVSNSWFNIS